MLILRIYEKRTNNLIVVNNNEERVSNDSIQGNIRSSLGNKGKEVSKDQESEVELEIGQEESKEKSG